MVRGEEGLREEMKTSGSICWGGVVSTRRVVCRANRGEERSEAAEEERINVCLYVCM